MQKAKVLVSRWHTVKGQILLKQVLNALKKGNLSSVKCLEKHQGLWDLRGAPLSTWTEEKTIYGTFAQTRQAFSIRSALIESVDFSFTDLGYATFRKCNLKNCLFELSMLKGAQLKACDFEDCIFISTNLSCSFLNINIGSNSGSFINCKFIKANLSNATFNFPLINKCLFQDCKLSTTNFDGSRFSNSTFIGEIMSSWFKGYSVYAGNSILGLFYGFNPRDYPNLMKNVDFSEAQLIGVSFTHNINLVDCILPDDERYIIINDLEHTMLSARDIIEAVWQGEDKRVGIHMIDKVYFQKDKHGIGRSIIDTFSITSIDDLFEQKFYDLIRRCN